MATADELLSGVGSVDNTFVIDSDLRIIRIPSNVTNLGVESDDDVRRVKFRMPSEYCGIDLSTFKIQINYLNANGEGDVYDVTDVKKINGSTLTFSWLIGRHAAAYKGDLKFNVCMKDIAQDGTVLREFNTTPASKPILEGLEVSEQAIIEYTDIFEQWRSMLFGVGDTEEQRLISTSAEQQENIIEKGAEVLATIPEDYTITYNNADNAVRTKADAIVQTAEGEVITVNDSSDDNLRGLHLFGKTTQVTTTGKNLLNVEETFTLSKTQGIPVSLPAGSYIVSITSETHSGDQQPYLRFYTNDVWIQLKNNHAQTAVLTVDETMVYLYTYGMSASESDGVTATFTQLMVSTSGGVYEPYSGGVVSPSPKCPQNLVSVENPVIDIYGKNLMDWGTIFSNLKVGSSECTTTVADGALFLSGTPSTNFVQVIDTMTPIPETWQGKKMYLRATISGTEPYMVMYIRDASNKSLTAATLTKTGACEFTMPSNAAYTLFAFCLNKNTTNVACTATYDNLYLGVEDAEYEKYKAVQSINVSRSLSGIPVESGGNYTDSTGQQWVCDEVDFERGVYVRRINTIVCDGTETVTREERYGGTYRFNIMPAVLVRANPYPGGYFSHFTYDIESPIGNNEVDRMFCMWTNGRIYGRYDDMASAEELSAWIVSQYESGTPLTAKYVLETPVETALTQDEIAAFKALHSNYPSTTILNNAGAHMQVDYNADTKLYIANTMTSVLEGIENGSY